MSPEFSGIERRLEKLKSCLSKLEPLKDKPINEFIKDSYLRDIVERNLELIAQSCIDIANRIISIEDLEKPKDYYEAIFKLGEAGILSIEFAKSFASIAGFRNILIHEYLEIDWEEVYHRLQNLQEVYRFMEEIIKWLKVKE